MIVIFAAVAASPTPTSSPSPSSDVCGGNHTSLLAAIDRPSIGYSACAVKPGEGLVEAGYSLAAGSDGNLAAYPQGLLRYGGATNAEFDLIGGGRFDSGFGAKYEWWHDAGRAFATDFLYTLPTGSAALSAGGPTQTLNLDYTMPLSPVVSISSTLGAQSDYANALSGKAGRFFNLLPSVVLSDQWNPRAQAFVEAYAQTRTRPDGGASFGIDAAIQYLIAPQVELDVEAGNSATDMSRSHYAGFGFGVRF